MKKPLLMHLNKDGKTTAELIPESINGVAILLKNIQKNKKNVECKAYGAYSGSHDGGGVEDILFWSKEEALKKCLELVAEFNKENKQSLEFALKGKEGKTQEVIDYYKDMYAPLEEVSENCWIGTIKDVRLVEYIIK